MKKITRFVGIFLVVALFAGIAMASGSSGSTAPDKTASSVDKAEEKPAVTIEEAVLLDANGLKITAKSLKTDGFMGPSLKLLIENDTSQNLVVQVRHVSVNGYMVDSTMSCDVAAGKKANDELTFMGSSLKVAGITTIADMEFTFHVFDGDTWKEVMDSDLIRIETSAAEGFEYTYDDSGDVLYSGNGVDIVLKGLDTDESWFGPGIVLYIYNSSDRDVMIQVRDVSVNGFMVDTIFSSDVDAGKHCLDAVTFLRSDLEENEITEIEEVTLSFMIADGDTWHTIEETQSITLNFAK